MCLLACVHVRTAFSFQITLPMIYFAAQCAPGTFSKTGLAPCEMCPVGTYQPSSGKTFCHRCEFDQLTDTEGATSKDDCGE